MTRILGIDLLTGSITEPNYAACLVDTINMETKLYERISSQELLNIVIYSSLDVLAVDHIQEILHYIELVDFLIDSDIQIMQVTSYGTNSRSLVNLTRTLNISIKSKPGALKSAIIASCLAVTVGTPTVLKRENGRIRFETREGRQSKYQNILNKKVKSQSAETTHRESYKQVKESVFVDKIEQVIGYGKESIVYRIKDIEGNDAIVKVYRTYSSIARRLKTETYKAKSAHIPLIMARDEIKSLQRIRKVGIPVPKVYFRDDNIVGMEAILYKDNIAFPLSKLSRRELDFNQVETYYYQALDYLYRLFEEGRIVHGDYSPNNLLVADSGLVVIDVSQANLVNTNTFVSTPNRERMDEALDILFRDLNGILNFFEKRFRIRSDREHVFSEFLGLIPHYFVDKVSDVKQRWSEVFRSRK